MPAQKALKAKGGAGKKAAGGLGKVLKVSPELATLLGTSEISRPALTKKMWAYFKEHQLTDPADKRFILCDTQLKAITGEDRFLGFGFQKHITKHILKD